MGKCPYGILSVNQGRERFPFPSEDKQLAGKSPASRLLSSQERIEGGRIAPQLLRFAMWYTNIESEVDAQLIKLTIQTSTSPFRFLDVLALLRESSDFRHFFNHQLSSMPFSAFRWETPPVTRESINRTFECVLINSPGLARTPDPRPFADYFTSGPENNVVSFPNLGNDAILIVPCPVAAHSAYGHIAAFVRNAPEQQQQALWQSVGQAMSNRLSSKPVWLSTAGAGVGWLHVRLDSRPKYYSYAPYKVPPAAVDQ